MSKKNNESENSMTFWIAYGIIVIIVLIVVALLGGLIYYIPGGSQGAIFNKIGSDRGYNLVEMPEGFGMKIPILQGIESLPYRTQTVSFCNENKESQVCDYPAITAKDKAAISFSIDVTVRYSLERDQVSEFVKHKGTSVKDMNNLIVTAARADSTRGVFGNYAQEDLPTLVNEITPIIQKRLQERINEEATGDLRSGFIKIEAIDMRNVAFAPEIEQKIIQKQQKFQAAEEKVFDITIANRTREEYIINADRDKQSAILRAEGEAEAIKKVGFAKADATQKLNDAYQDMPATFVSSKWAESINDNDKIIFGLDNMGSGVLPIIDVNEMTGMLKNQNKTS